MEFILELLASGASQADVLVAYPQLTAESLAAALVYAARSLKKLQEPDGLIQVTEEPAAEMASNRPYEARFLTSSRTNERFGNWNSEAR